MPNNSCIPPSGKVTAVGRHIDQLNQRARERDMANGLRLLKSISRERQVIAIRLWAILRGARGDLLAAALKVAENAPAGSVLLGTLPDASESYLSTFLFEGVDEGSDGV